MLFRRLRSSHPWPSSRSCDKRQKFAACHATPSPIVAYGYYGAEHVWWKGPKAASCPDFTDKSMSQLVIRDRVEPVASPAISAMPSKAEVDRDHWRHLDAPMPLAILRSSSSHQFELATRQCVHAVDHSHGALCGRSKSARAARAPVNNGNSGDTGCGPLAPPASMRLNGDILRRWETIAYGSGSSSRLSRYAAAPDQDAAGR